MMTLARLLFRDRWRKLNRHYGRVEYGSASLVLILFGWLGAVSASRYVRQATASHLELQMSAIWISWVLMAAVTGKDLCWRIGLERIRALPSPGFLRIYISTFILGFLSFPLLTGLCVIQYWVWLRGGLRFTHVATTLIGYLLFVSTARLSGSLGRSVLHFGKYLSPLHKRAAALLAWMLAAFSLISFLRPEIGVPHPGQLFGQLIATEACVYPFAGMGLGFLLLALVDFILKRDLTYSCVQLMTPGLRLVPFSTMFMLYPFWPGPIFRIGILGWLRSRTAFMLFLWGGAYSFLWTFFSKPGEASYFILFTFMNMIFHCYLRGNLLGIDRAAAWFYYRFPVRVEKALSSKSLSLSFLQGCMIAALFVAGFLRTRPYVTAMDWIALFSYAVSAILFGEISGFFFSILYPESIDRTSQFDGGATAGNIAVGLLQFAFMIFFFQMVRNARHFEAHGYYWGLFLAVPLFLGAIRTVVLKTWVHQTMWAKREIILKKLTWF
jgi:hypothetical protein